MKILMIFTTILFVGCTTDATSTTTSRISCRTTAECAAAGGGTCTAGECRADNECATAVDCASGQVCVRSTAFGGLCGVPGSTPLPQPGIGCRADGDCPSTAACATDRVCHPISHACSSALVCPSGERCDPICTTSGATAGYECRPDGLPTLQCAP